MKINLKIALLGILAALGMLGQAFSMQQPKSILKLSAAGKNNNRHVHFTDNSVPAVPVPADEGDFVMVDLADVPWKTISEELPGANQPYGCLKYQYTPTGVDPNAQKIALVSVHGTDFIGIAQQLISFGKKAAPGTMSGYQQYIASPGSPVSCAFFETAQALAEEKQQPIELVFFLWPADVAGQLLPKAINNHGLRLAQFIGETCRDTTQEIILFGHSNGGRICWEAAPNICDHVKPRTSVVTLATPLPSYAKNESPETQTVIGQNLNTLHQGLNIFFEGDTLASVGTHLLSGSSGRCLKNSWPVLNITMRYQDSAHQAPRHPSHTEQAPVIRALPQLLTCCTTPHAYKHLLCVVNTGDCSVANLEADQKYIARKTGKNCIQDLDNSKSLDGRAARVEALANAREKQEEGLLGQSNAEWLEEQKQSTLATVQSVRTTVSSAVSRVASLLPWPTSSTSAPTPQPDIVEKVFFGNETTGFSVVDFPDMQYHVRREEHINACNTHLTTITNQLKGLKQKHSECLDEKIDVVKHLISVAHDALHNAQAQHQEIGTLPQPLHHADNDPVDLEDFDCTDNNIVPPNPHDDYDKFMRDLEDKINLAYAALTQMQ